MVAELGQQAKKYQEEVNHFRNLQEPVALAQALENFASALVKEAAPVEAAEALEEAADIWISQSDGRRAGSCLLLAASSNRIAGDFDRAKKCLAKSLTAEIPAPISRGLEMEKYEQELATGNAKIAFEGFSELLDKSYEQLDENQKAQLLQRKSAAALAANQWENAAEAMLSASKIFKKNGLHLDAEAAALAAATILADKDSKLAEQIYQEISSNIPHDGAAQARRGLVGGKIAMDSGNPQLAIERFDLARQGALDVVDSVTYLTAAISASTAAEATKNFSVAYGRLATAWASLAKLVGMEIATQMVKPVLEDFRLRVGEKTFLDAKKSYEVEQKNRR